MRTVVALTIALGSWLSAQVDREVLALRRMLDTVNAGDARGYASLYAPEAVVTIHGSGELRGRAAIEQHEVQLLKQFPGTRLAMFEIWRARETTIAHYAVNGKTPAGQAMGHEGLLFFRFDASGLIVEEHRYLDSLTPMAQLGALRNLSIRSLPQVQGPPAVHVETGSPRETANLETVRRVFGALNGGNEDAVLATLADTVTIDEVMLATPFVGHADARTWFALWKSAASSEASVVITRAVAVADFVLLEVMQRGTLVRPFGVVQPDEKPFSVHRAAIVRVDNGKVTRITAFLNGKELAESLGQWPLRSPR